MSDGFPCCEHCGEKRRDVGHARPCDICQSRDEPLTTAATGKTPIKFTTTTEPTAPAEGRESVEAAVEQRIRDFLRSTSEFYLRGSDEWVAGLVGYIMRGPGSLSEVLEPMEGRVAAEGGCS